MGSLDPYAASRARAVVRAAHSQAFCRKSLDLIEAHRPASAIAWNACGKKRREQIARIVLSEWEMLCPELSLLPAGISERVFRDTLRDNVRRRIREEKVGFVWWLPILYAVAEIVIRLLIERWLAR